MSIDRTSTGLFITAPAGLIVPYGRNDLPATDWLLCDGSAVSRASYTDLFDTIVPSKGSFTVTIASPAVVTLNSHGFNDGDAVFLTTSGALPTGLSANTLYYVKSPAANTFNLAASRGGANINTSGSQSGTHSLYFCPYGLGDGSTTFNVPDLRGRLPVGLDNIGGSAAGRLSVNDALGLAGGAQTHTLTTGQLPAHSHFVSDPFHNHSEVWSATTAFSQAPRGGGNDNVVGSTFAAFTGISTGSTGGGGAHDNLQPFMLISYIIKT